MATTLIQQSTRADDERFRSQVRAALMRDLPDLLVATLGGVYAPGADANAQAQNAGKAQAFARRIVEERERVVQQVAQAVAGLAFPAADDDEPIRIGEIVAASDPGIVHVTIDVSKTLANVTETQDGRFVLWMAIPREAWPGKI